jgi:hypothetical protein
MGKLKRVISHRGAWDLVNLFLECGHNVVCKDRGIWYPRNEGQADDAARAYAAGEGDAPPRAVCPACAR